MNDAVNIGSMLENLRVHLGLSLNAFGQKIGYSGKQIARYEKGVSLIPEEVLDKVICVFSVNPEYFQGSVAVANAVSVPDYEKDKLDVAARVRLCRLESGLTQKKLAELCDCCETQISLIERGKISVTLAMASHLAHALCVGVDWILTGNEFRKRYPVDGVLLDWLWQHEDVRKELWERMEKK